MELQRAATSTERTELAAAHEAAVSDTRRMLAEAEAARHAAEAEARRVANDASEATSAGQISE